MANFFEVDELGKDVRFTTRERTNWGELTGLTWDEAAKSRPNWENFKAALVIQDGTA
jgi:hypothetical protein